MPVCPLCNTPCPVKKGDTPDVVVGRHIDNDCQSDSAKQRRKVMRTSGVCACVCMSVCACIRVCACVMCVCGSV